MYNLNIQPLIWNDVFGSELRILLQETSGAADLYLDDFSNIS